MFVRLPEGFSVILRVLTFLIAALTGGTTAAQFPIAGNYGLGAGLGQTSAILPPQGTRVIENGWINYNIQSYVDDSGNDIGAPTSTVNAARLTFRYVFRDVKLLGADYSAGAVFTYRDQVLRPEPGLGQGYHLGDTVVTPIALGWHQRNWHFQASYTFWAPTGEFEAGGTTNTGKGLWSHMLFAGTTWKQDARLPWAATFQARYEKFGRQETTDIRPGDVLSLEFAFGKAVAQGFNLGLLAARSFQVSRQNGTSGGDPAKYEINLIGAEGVWKPKTLPGAQIALRLGKEFDNRNTTEGFAALLSLAYAF
ncbi:SphA family protein [Ruegeria arenilitoris]|uniref:SphA family protein n=1 Tax=Ruegeria arenilitoris TaxID=1173585 RepID=UPI00147F1E86|nr:transporter [Ruegeria arenilitoris]